MSGPFKKVLRRMKRSFSSKETSMTETPKIKRAMFRPGDISIDSESGAPYSATRITDDTSITPVVPVTVTPQTINDNMTKTPSTTKQTTPPANGPSCSQTHKHAPAIWLTFCLTTVAVIFPREKAKAIGEAFIKLLGSERVRPLKESKAGLLFKIRDDALNQAKHFSFDRFDFKLIAQTKLARGVIQVPKNADIDKLKNDLKNKSNVEAVHSGLKNNVITVTFKTENAPTNILGHNVKPALLATLRCFKCQMFGHASNVCNNNAKCPHCAGNHSHASFNTRHARKCANCGGGHSAAYKGCPIYLKYQSTINSKNLKVTNQYINNLQAINKRPNLAQIAKQLVGKSETEILSILKNKFPENEAQYNIEHTTPTPPEQPASTSTTNNVATNNVEHTFRHQQQQQHKLPSSSQTSDHPKKMLNPIPSPQQTRQQQQPRQQRHHQQRHRISDHPAYSPFNIHRNRLRMARNSSTPIMRHSLRKGHAIAPPLPVFFRHAYGIY